MNPTVSASQILKGRVLTRHVTQQKTGLSLEYVLATASGPVIVEIPEQEHVCFIRTTDEGLLSEHRELSNIRCKRLPLRNFQRENVSALYCSDIRQQRNLIRVAKDQAIELYESDIKAEHRFLIERFIALDTEFIGHYVDAKQGIEPRFIAKKARPAELVQPLKAISLDFECSFSGELYSVGLYGQTENGAVFEKVIMVGQPQEVEVNYIQWVNNEVALIHELVAWFKEYDPDIIIGWSVVTFDLALLYRRAKHHGIALAIGRNNQNLSWKVEDKYRPETLSLYGRVVLDGIDWLKAAFYQFDRYSLEFVSRTLLDEGKAIDNVGNRMDEINDLFANDKPALAHYNLTESRLVWDIFKKTQLFDFAIERAKLTGLELGRVGASVAAFMNLYLPHLHRSGYVAPSTPASDGIESPGGYVMDSVPGLYKHILVLDFKSLYPSIIRTFLIDPKGLVESVQEDDSETVAGYLGASFSRKTPILPQLIKHLSEQREQAKANQDAPLSQAIKIIMNSLYGVLGSRGCVFHDAKLASSITMRGHEIMKQTRSWIEEEGFEVIYGDTDSTFVWLGNDYDEQQVQATGKRLASKVNQQWRQKLTDDFKLESFLELEFETHFEQFFMPTLRGSAEGSKKRYVGTKLTVKGEKELIFKGMEQVRSDWSPLARRVQYELYERLFNHQDVEGYIKSTIEKLNRGAYSEELIFVKNLRRNLEDYTAKSSPHLKAARLLFDATNDESVTKRGARIEYVMTISGAEPVSHQTSPIDFDYYINRQLGPIAEPILSIMNKSFSQVTSNQMTLI
ncbi:DNA polymerase B, exonuclease:DNA polymerase B region [Shewanella piezotolerans WP3]|uniref:DNA polymerase n=1 Tax=Shewanella piezotolerans (strain WP3 / JCM 13877) TaxID=225849 RepID=B8CRB1_SHEPW|nr:DNA polymerase II [Shewanella piezotolerans]ACJ29919.1 DNA polymerase B, exonuclease:DNA polymerase B region [Shewanella piezotolerans WP3]